MNCRRFLFSLAALALALVLSRASAAETSDPVGVFRLRLRGSSDTIVSLPLQRPALLEAVLASRNGNSLTLDATVPTLPTEGAFALVMTGALEGAVLPISSAISRTLTVEATGLDLTPLKTASVNGTTSAETIALVPYWTLDTLFPNGKGVNASTSATTRNSEVLLFDGSLSGINLSASATFFYFAGTPSKTAGWYKVGATTTTLGTQRLAPHTYFIVRHNVATETSLQIYGGVQMSGFLVPLRLRTANTDQDNLVALPIATPITLGASRLVESGAFKPSTSAAVRTDELLVFDNALIGYNKSASATYFYFAGTPSKAAGWYQVGATASTADSFTLKPGEGYVIRKRQATAPQVNAWNAVPGYLK